MKISKSKSLDPGYLVEEFSSNFGSLGRHNGRSGIMKNFYSDRRGFQAKKMVLGMAQRLESDRVISKRVNISDWLGTWSHRPGVEITIRKARLWSKTLKSLHCI